LAYAVKTFFSTRFISLPLDYPPLLFGSSHFFVSKPIPVTGRHTLFIHESAMEYGERHGIDIEVLAIPADCPAVCSDWSPVAGGWWRRSVEILPPVV
jgi:hypothetical protein